MRGDVANTAERDFVNALFRAAAPVVGAAPLFLDWLDSPLGPLLAVADANDLLLLEFSGRSGLERAVASLAATGPLAPGRSAPIDGIEGELADYFAGRSAEFRTPFRLDGSPFQVGVWRRLQRIPPGSTISYLQLATNVGNPKAFRAVAQANGANRLAVIVPCHRVINTNGQLGGYGGGLPRKSWLLQHERQSFGAGSGRLF